MIVLPRASRLREENNCHEPGGRPTGGQFAKKGSQGCAVQSTGEQPVLTDQKTGAPKFSPPPQPEPKTGVQIERPKGSKKKGTQAATNKIDDFTDNSPDGDADEALSALGVNMSAHEIAQGMVSAIEGERFSVEVTTEGYSGGESYDGPDPDDVRSDYDEWHTEQAMEASSEAWDDQRKDFIRNSDEAYLEAGAAINQALSKATPEGSLYTADTHEAWYATKDDAAKQAAIDHSLALAEIIFDADNEVLTEEGMYDRGGGKKQEDGTFTAGRSQKKIEAHIADYLADNPGAQFMPFAEAYGDAGMDNFDTNYRIERSKYFNDNDGRDNWIEDGHEDSAIDSADIDSFDSWYEREYGHSPDKYGEGGGGEFDSDSTKVTFSFSGTNNSSITRSFYMRDGELHVHHDYFTAGGEGDGLAKQLYQGSLPTYDKMGVQHISTMANIDVGSYAWARFGFQADSPYSLAQAVETRAKRLFKDTGLFDDGDWESFTNLIDEHEKSFIWDVVDAKYYTTPEKALALVTHFEERGIGNEIGQKKMRQEAERGVVSVGRTLMVDSNISWNGTLDLHDEESVKRLEGYVGVWRESRQGLRSEPTPAPPSGPRPPSPARVAAAKADPLKPIQVSKSSFNRLYSAAAKKRTLPGEMPARAPVYTLMRAGFSFDEAIRRALKAGW